MRFELSIKMGNAAMENTHDVADAIRHDVLPKLDSGVYSGSIRDTNGNTVGRFSVHHKP